MRTIDADALTRELKSIKTTFGSGNGLVEGGLEIAISTTNAMPTVGEWVPCSERLPEDSGEYLVCPSDSVLEDYSDFSEVMIMPYDADYEGFGWWRDRFDPVSLGYVDSDFIEYEVLAWMRLPKPWKGETDEKVRSN